MIAKEYETIFMLAENPLNSLDLKKGSPLIINLFIIIFTTGMLSIAHEIKAMVKKNFIKLKLVLLLSM